MIMVRLVFFGEQVMAAICRMGVLAAPIHASCDNIFLYEFGKVGSCMRLRVLPFTVFVLIVVVFTVPHALAADYRMYDPNLYEEMKASGLLETMSPEEFEREMATLNESENKTLGCDDFPRCDPTVLHTPLSAYAVLTALGLVVVLSGKGGKW